MSEAEEQSNWICMYCPGGDIGSNVVACLVNQHCNLYFYWTGSQCIDCNNETDGLLYGELVATSQCNSEMDKPRYRGLVASVKKLWNCSQQTIYASEF